MQSILFNLKKFENKKNLTYFRILQNELTEQQGKNDKSKKLTPKK
jgi:hypothetical protein